MNYARATTDKGKIMRYIYPARAPSQRKTHPIVFVAAASVILFSLAGGAAVLGYQPLAQSQSVSSAGCNTGKLFDNSMTNSTSSALNSNVADSQDSFESDMPSIGNSGNKKQPFDVLITKS